MIRGRINKPLASLTKLEAELESKYRAKEEDERLEAIGQPSDLKAKTWVQKDFQAREDKERRIWEQDIQILLKLRTYKHRSPYFRYLTQVFLRFAAEEDIPKKYGIEVDITDVGLIVKIAGTKFYGAFKVCGLPSYDHRFCKTLAIKLGNTIAHLEGYRRQTETGVLLPDEADLHQYGF